MKNMDIVGIAFGNFKRRKMRSFLTVLGVVIGVASIVVMVSLGIAGSVALEEQIKEMGDLTTVEVYPGFDEKTMKQGTLDDKTISQIATIDKVIGVSPEMQLNGKMVAGKFLSSPQIVGIRPEFAAKLGLKPEQGSLEQFGTVSGKTINCLFGSEIAYQFYNPKDRGGGGGMGGMVMSGGFGGSSGEKEERPPPLVNPMDEEIRLRFTFDWMYGEKKRPGQTPNPVKAPMYNLKNLAVLKSGGNSEYKVYISMDDAIKLKKDQEKYNAGQNGGGGNTVKKRTATTYDVLKVLTASINDTVSVVEEVKAMGLQAYSSGEWIASYKKQTQMQQLILGGIGSVSLLVAAIGITNTMIMSIYERTREIGIMKVIGCQLKDIRSMFLYEAAFIGLFGGALGLGISYGISALLNVISKNSESGGGGMMGMGGGGAALSVVPVWLAVSAVVFAIAIGLISGFLPARRAMRLSALEAMRT